MKKKNTTRLPLSQVRKCQRCKGTTRIMVKGMPHPTVCNRCGGTGFERFVKVGMRFKLSVSLPYSDHGVHGNHRIVSIIEVTEVDKSGWNASYKTVEVISEEGKPSFADEAINSTGGFSIPMFLQGKNPSLEAL